jgi:hypothetical protein
MTTKQEFGEIHLVHSYVRAGFSENGSKMIWKCDDPFCPHTIMIPKKNRKLLLGKMTLCPGCKITKFILTSFHLKRARPICEDCRNPMRKMAFEKGKEILEGLFDKQQGIEEPSK